MIKIKGLAELEKKIAQIPHKTMNGVKMAVEYIYDKSQPLVPVDTGRLKESGKITRLSDGYSVSYRALNPENQYNYAPIQHEHLGFRHTVGQAKYLEHPVRMNMAEIKDIIMREVMK